MTEFILLEEQNLLELSISNLRNNNKRNFGMDREIKSHKIGISNYQAIPSITDKTLLLKCTVKGEDANYDVKLRFINVIYLPEGTPDAIEIIGMDGNKYYIRPLTSSQKQVKVSCTCLDFYYRFAIWNHGKKSLEGEPPPPYIKTTNRPPVNPNKVPGACKHIIKFVDFLKGERLIR